MQVNRDAPMPQSEETHRHNQPMVGLSTEMADCTPRRTEYSTGELAVTASGPTGDRAEHLRQCRHTRHLGIRRHRYRALGRLTVRAARGMLPSRARWILNTALVLLLNRGRHT